MIQKKVALLGASGVGKTSLVRRFVASVFDEKYLTTIGVKVDKKVVTVRGRDVSLMLWDVAGAEEHFSVPSGYVRGAAGYLLVVDATRPDTLETARELAVQVAREVGALPHVVVLNKSDLTDAQHVDCDGASAAIPTGAVIIRTSAKTGDGVDDAFQRLADAIIEP